MAAGGLPLRTRELVTALAGAGSGAEVGRGVLTACGKCPHSGRYWVLQPTGCRRHVPGRRRERPHRPGRTLSVSLSRWERKDGRSHGQPPQEAGSGRPCRTACAGKPAGSQIRTSGRRRPARLVRQPCHGPARPPYTSYLLRVPHTSSLPNLPYLTAPSEERRARPAAHFAHLTTTLVTGMPEMSMRKVCGARFVRTYSSDMATFVGPLPLSWGAAAALVGPPVAVFLLGTAFTGRGVVAVRA
jgi:hypothetical protein